MKDTLIEIFTWWNGQTMGTRFHTWRHGELVGTDEFGNRYFQTRGGKVDPTIGVVRRWMLFAGEIEATKVPPGWHAWLRNTTDVPPGKDGYAAREWQLGWRPNPTGTPNAYRPKGSILASGTRPAATGDYEAWTPGS
ncbi:NADH:ubiquinone oxidoreductase subunit NDUFA12 [Alsobacter sp. R-9]